MSQEIKATAFLPQSSAPRKAFRKPKLPAGMSLLLLEEETNPTCVQRSPIKLSLHRFQDNIVDKIKKWS